MLASAGVTEPVEKSPYPKGYHQKKGFEQELSIPTPKRGANTKGGAIGPQPVLRRASDRV